MPGSAVTTGVLLLALLAAAALAQPAQQMPEPNCNSNKYEGHEVWSSTDNFIGQGAGSDWWGVKAAQTATPVSWVDFCAQRLELCQADAAVPGSASEFKPRCVCDMWTCLNQPRQNPSSEGTPGCLHIRPFLLNYYCNAALAANATCAGEGQLPLPANRTCPATPTEGFTFDDMPGDGIRIPNGYQGLLWDNMHMLNGDNYQVKNGFYTGVVSSPNVAFNGYGYPGTVSAPDNGELTLHSLWLASAWDQDNAVAVTAENFMGNIVGTYKVVLNTDAPLFVDLAAPEMGEVSGTFAGVKSITITTKGTQVAVDNLHITLAPEQGKTITPPPASDLEFFRAPPGASSPNRKPRRAKRQQEEQPADAAAPGAAHPPEKAG